MCKSGGALAVKMSTQLSQRELDGKFMFMSCYSVCPTNTNDILNATDRLNSTSCSIYLTLGVHAQRGLRYLSCVCVCVCICPAGLICGLALVDV